MLKIFLYSSDSELEKSDKEPDSCKIRNSNKFKIENSNICSKISSIKSD